MSGINALVQGILLGGHYALLACGLAFLYRVMRVINLAHGAFAVLASFACWVAADRWGINPFIALIGVIPAMALVGWGLQRAVLEPSTRHGLLVPILATFGLAVLIDNLLFLQFGADPRSLVPYIGSLAWDSWAIGDQLYIAKLSALAFAIAVVLLGGLSLFLSRTAIGRAIRATSEDPATVGLTGINPRQVNAIAAAIALATVGIAGVFLGLRGTVSPYSGFEVLIYAFIAAEIGGGDSLWGTLIGGIALGVAQSFGALVDPQGFLIAGYGLFLIIVIGRVLLSQTSRARIRAITARLIQWT